MKLDQLLIPPPPPVGQIAYSYPLRKGYRAQLVLPDNLSAKEAERLCALIKTLVLEESK